MELLQLNLQNFKGMKKFTLKPDGANVSIYGDNATGKTTIVDAVFWLLFDKDSRGNSKFEIKTLKNGEVVHKLDHSVEGEFSTDNGNITLKKVYQEDYKKKRGSATETFTGHTTDYFVDGVPALKKEYTEAVEKIAKEDVFKLLTSPTYFPEQLHWQERRNILLDVCGDISDIDVIAYNPELAELTAILAGKAPEDVKKIILSRRTLLNKELDSIPTRVDEVEQGIPELPANTSSIQSKVDEITGLLVEEEAKAQRIKNGAEIVVKKKELATVETKIIGIENAFTRKRNETVGGIETQIAESEKFVAEQRKLSEASKVTVKNHEDSIKNNAALMGQLRTKWQTVNDKKFEHAATDVCPTCNQYLPEEQVAEARIKAEASFNKSKAETLERINTDGVLLKKSNNELVGAIEKLLSDIDTINDRITQSLTELENLNAKKSEALALLPTTENNKDYKAATIELEEIAKALKKLEEGDSLELEKTYTFIQKATEERYLLLKELAKVDQIEAANKRILALEGEQKTLSAEFEKLEGHLFLIDLFTKSKVNMLEDKINGKFELARFKLFAEQINGGLLPCCEVVAGGVPYSTGLNNAGRINVGLDIINTLSGHYGVNLPAFIDNAESVVDLLTINSQMIRLVVSADDKKLRVA